MSEREAAKVMQDGVMILDAVLVCHGFTATKIKTSESSGGSYASCEFKRWNRRLQLHFRNSLGLVEYKVGSISLSHEDFMWAVQGRRGASHYPGFSDDPLDAFRRLAVDLTEHGLTFLNGSVSDFAAHAEHSRELKARSPRLPE